MIDYIKGALAIILGISLLILIVTNLYPTLTNVSISNQSIGFADNDTYYSLNKSIYTASPYIPLLRYANGTTNVTNYTYNASHVMIGANIANGTSYYGYYTYYNKPWVGGQDYGWSVTMIIFIVLIVIAIKFTVFMMPGSHG